jgi:ribosome-binding factor A
MKNTRRPDARQARSESFAQPSEKFELSETTETHSPSSHRQARLERILLTELQSLLRDEASDPALDGIQLLHLTLAPDGGHARLGYAVETSLETERDAKHRTHPALLRATGFLRARLASQLNLKRVPKLSFTFVGVGEVGGPDDRGGDPWRG